MLIKAITSKVDECSLVEVFLLGAGSPARGRKPSALKNITLDTSALDWQLDSFLSDKQDINIHFLGGYHIDEVIENYLISTR